MKSSYQKYVYSEAATRDVLYKKVFLKISQNSQENTCARVSFLIKLQAWSFFLFSCEFCEIFAEHLWKTVSIYFEVGQTLFQRETIIIISKWGELLLSKEGKLFQSTTINSKCSITTVKLTKLLSQFKNNKKYQIHFYGVLTDKMKKSLNFVFNIVFINDAQQGIEIVPLNMFLMDFNSISFQI